jgi:N-methylhydantoinase B
LKLDPFALEVASTRLVALMDECATTMVRQSFSPMVRNSNDFACLLLDREGYAVAQSTLSIPVFTGTLPHTVRWMIDHFSEIDDGDALITNDPWHGTGHLPDINVALPVFHRGELVAWIASVAHAPDIGGRIWGTGAQEVFEEGLYVPPLKLATRGKPNRQLRDLIAGNVRIPEQTLGDIDAQLAANRLGARRLISWLDGNDLPDLEVLARELQRRSDLAMREAIGMVPDGTYTSATWTDGPDGPLVVRCAVIVDRDEIRVDYDGTSSQVDAGINCVLQYTRAFSVYALKCVLDPETPNNDGTMRAISVNAPEGSILNPSPPAAVAGRHVIGHLTPTAIFRALDEVIPGGVIAESAVPLWWIVVAGQRHGATASLSFALNGGLGARPTKGGLDAVSFPSNISAVPVEVCEAIAPIRFQEKRLRRASGGRGMFAGGRGQRVSMEVVGSARLQMSVLGGGVVHPPQGVQGGGSGACAGAWLNGKPLSAKTTEVLAPGDVVVFETAGGGGYGSDKN